MRKPTTVSGLLTGLLLIALVAAFLMFGNRTNHAPLPQIPSPPAVAPNNQAADNAAKPPAVVEHPRHPPPTAPPATPPVTETPQTDEAPDEAAAIAPDKVREPRESFSVTVAGRVTDGNGLPIEGAALTGNLRHWRAMRTRDGKDVITSAGLVTRNVGRLATTDSAGLYAFTLDVAPENDETSLILMVAAPGYNSTTRSLPNLQPNDFRRDTDFVLGTYPRVQGRVVDQRGYAAPDTIVQVMRPRSYMRSPGLYSSQDTLPAIGVTDADGRFEIIVRDAGTYSLSVLKHGWTLVESPEPVEVALGETAAYATDAVIAPATSLTFEIVLAKTASRAEHHASVFLYHGEKRLGATGHYLDEAMAITLRDIPVETDGIRVTVPEHKPSDLIPVSLTPNQENFLSRVTLEKASENDEPVETADAPEVAVVVCLILDPSYSGMRFSGYTFNYYTEGGDLMDDHGVSGGIGWASSSSGPPPPPRNTFWRLRFTPNDVPEGAAYIRIDPPGHQPTELIPLDFPSYGDNHLPPIQLAK